MKKVFLKIGTSILITLLVAICLIFVGMAYLFLYPKGELFGIVYVSEKLSKVYTVGEYNINELSQIEVNTNGFDIQVDTDDSDTVRAYVKTRITGFALKKNSETRFEYDYNENELKLALNMNEATGWLSANDSYIKLVVPQVLMKNNISLKLSTGKKSDININGRNVSKLSNLDITLNRGKFFFDGLEAENIFIKANKADIKAGKDVVGTTNYMALDVNNSKVNLLSAGEGEKYLKENIPEVDKISFKVNDLVIKSATRNSSIKLFNCDFMYTDTSCEATAGNITIYYLGKANVNAKDTNINIYRLINEDDSIFKFSGKGDLSINQNFAVLNVTTTFGDVYIKMSDAVMALETKDGTITVEKARKPISLITSNGEANIKFDEDSTDGEYTVEREIISLRTYYGNIKIEGLEKISGVVDNGGAPTIELHFNKVISESVLDVKKANLKIIVPENEAVTLNLICDNAELDIHVGTATREGNHNGDFVRTVYASSTTNVLKISTSGYINIMSKDIYELKK